MGRYFYTNNFEGKFGFGVQSSFDPEGFYGMDASREMVPYGDGDNEAYEQLSFYMQNDYENAGRVFTLVNGLYDMLKIPAEKRRFTFDTQEALTKYIDSSVILKAVYKKHSGGNEPRYALPGSNDTFEPKFKNSVLIHNRIYLGLVILNDLRLDGFCSMDAEE